jgi:hypothetical protein
MSRQPEVAPLPLYVVTLTDGRCTTAEADTLDLACASAALQFGMDDLPAGAVVMEVSE